MAPPAARAESAWITSTFMESTRDTAEMAAEPTLLTIMVSTVPIRQLKSCSTIMGMRSFLRSRLLYIWLELFIGKSSFCDVSANAEVL